MAKYTIGVDFGSLSGRAVLADTADGRIVATADKAYDHAVMERQLPDGTPLGKDWALQHPQDYLDVLADILPKVASQVNPEEIVGLGIDFTCSTALPVDEQGTPLCFKPDFQSVPQAYVMMWKHHGCQDQANRMTEVAEQRKEPWLKWYGGKVNAEWYFPKLLEVLEEAPHVYQAMAHYVEAADWIAWQLTGQLSRSVTCLGYKSFYMGQFPDKAYFKAVNPAFENVVEEKVSGPIVQLGQCIGHVTEKAAKLFGLPAGIPVATPQIDAHVAAPAAGIDVPGKMLAIIGTSGCYHVLGDERCSVPGINGMVEGGLMPGYPSYEAGISSLGDMYYWYERFAVPEYIKKEATERGMHVQSLLTEKASRLKPGQSGLIALDWWNGNRCVLADTELTGMILGMTLQTQPEEIYRALIEATAFGTRMIVDTFQENGVPVKALYATGGIPKKNPMAMQIMADVLGMPIYIAAPDQGPALGSAIFGAVAAGVYASPAAAIQTMSYVDPEPYWPNAANGAVYEELYQEYKRLHDYFGRGENNVMKRLKALANRV